LFSILVLAVLAEPSRGQQSLYLSDIDVLYPLGTGVVSFDLSADSRGTIHVAIRRGAVRYRKSSDLGQSFGPEIVVQDPEGAASFTRDARIISDDQQRACVFWIDSRGDCRPSLRMNCSQDGGETWRAADIHVSENDTGVQVFPGYQVAFDDNGILYCCYQDARDDTFELELWFRRSLDGGGCFEPEIIPLWTTARFPESIKPVAMQADGQGAVYILLWRILENTRELYLQTSLDFGVTWLGPVLVDPVPELTLDPALVCGPSGVVQVVWTGFRNVRNHIYFARSTDFGRTFAPTVQMDSQGNSVITQWPAIDADLQGSAYLVWRNDRDIHLRISRDHGETWEPEVSLGSTFAWSVPRVFTNESGHVVVEWQARFATEFGEELNVSFDAGETWLPQAVRFDATGGGTTVGRGQAMDAAGRFYMLWDEEFDMGPVIDTETHFRAAYPTLAGSLVARDDGDGIVIIPPEGGELAIDIELWNHDPLNRIESLTAYLEAELPSGQRVGPLGRMRTFNIPIGVGRSATLRRTFPGARPPGRYAVIVTTTGPIEASFKLPILKE
jgi:hypothetical protein